ncbi:unnamed protein product, partial [Dibothriocephalus latus]
MTLDMKLYEATAYTQWIEGDQFRMNCRSLSLCLLFFSAYTRFTLNPMYSPTQTPHILLCLDHIPVSEQKQVQTDSCLMDIVKQWTIDPHFCLSRVAVPLPTSAPSTQPAALVGLERSSTDEQSTSGETLVSTTNPPSKNEGQSGESANAASPHSPRAHQIKSSITDIVPADHVSASSASAAETSDKSESSSAVAAAAAKAEEEKETDALTKASEYKVYSAAEEQLIVDKIRILASRILERWLSLP